MIENKPEITYAIVKGVEAYLSKGLIPITFVTQQNVNEFIHNTWHKNVEIRALVLAIDLAIKISKEH